MVVQGPGWPARRRLSSLSRRSSCGPPPDRAARAPRCCCPAAAREFAVADQTVPFPVQSGQHLHRGRVHQVRGGGPGAAFGVDGGPCGVELFGGSGVVGAGGCGGGQRGVRAVERADPLQPGRGPRLQVRVGVAGADEVAAYVRPAPEVVRPVQAAQGLVDGVEVRGLQQRRPPGRASGSAPVWSSGSGRAGRPGPSATAMVNTVVSGPRNTQHHHRCGCLCPRCERPASGVSSTCRCPPAAFRSLILSASGASRSEQAANTPARAPSVRSSPSWASAATMRCTGRPSTNFSHRSRSQTS
jgi:hypothetical protein